jgi:glycosyltransferase involved in cell wall biosynthesis
MNRILLIVPGNKGTISACSLNLYNALKEESDVIVKCIYINHFADGYAGFDNCEYFNNNHGFFKTFRRLLWVKEIKKKYKPDISISTLLGSSILNVLTGNRDLKIGIFHAPIEQSRINGKIYYFFSLFLHKYLYSLLDKFFCVSLEAKKSLLKNIKSIHPDNVHLVYNIHDISNIKTKADEKLTDEEIDLFSKDVILYCGRTDDNKAPNRLIDAFLSNQMLLDSDCQLVFIGEDPDVKMDYLKLRSKVKNIENRVHFLGRKSNPYKYMKSAKVLVSCSYSESLPGVIIESLILGTPIVSTNSSIGIWEILSCADHYTSSLNSIKVTNNGVITSNLSFTNKSKYMSDCESLANGIEYILTNNLRYNNFKFQSNVEKDNIVRSYVDIAS